MNSFAISANSAWSTLSEISDRAWYAVGLLSSPRAIAIYRKIILGTIAVCALVYALGIAARNVWEWTVERCAQYETQCRQQQSGPEAIAKQNPVKQVLNGMKAFLDSKDQSSDSCEPIQSSRYCSSDRSSRSSSLRVLSSAPTIDR